VFEKAQRKVMECTFFLRQLCETQDPDATGFFFNALLNAGKNVVYALYAQVLSCESASMGLPSDSKQVKERANKSYQDHIKAWKRATGGFSLTLFDVSQDARDIETHANQSAMGYLSQTEERQYPRSVPSDPQYAAVVINYLSRRQLSPYVTVPTTIYYLQMDPAVAAKKSVQARLKQFAKRKPQPIAELATTYRDLLDLLVTYFITQYVPPAPAQAP
jgi:hypothetical protein